jgi:hypothetical protein
MLQSFSHLYARVAGPEQIAFVKFIVESYDGLAILSTANPENGEILLRFHPAQRDELVDLLSALQVNLDLTQGNYPKPQP